MRNSKSTRVSRTLLSILANLCNGNVWIVSIRPLISNSSSHLSELLGTIPNVPIINGITIILRFHFHLSFQARSKYLYLFFRFPYFLIGCLLELQNPPDGKFSIFPIITGLAIIIIIIIISSSSSTTTTIIVIIIVFLSSFFS